MELLCNPLFWHIQSSSIVRLTLSHNRSPLGNLGHLRNPQDLLLMMVTKTSTLNLFLCAADFYLRHKSMLAVRKLLGINQIFGKLSFLDCLNLAQDQSN